MLVSRIGLVELNHGEFRVVFRGNSFVSKCSSKFINSLKPSDDKSFKVKLGSYSQVKVHVKSVVMSNKRFCGRTSRDRVKHGGLYFQKIPFVKKPSDEIYHLRPCLKNLFGSLVSDQIQVTLAVSCLDVLETMPFFRERSQGLCEKKKFPDLYGKLSGSGLKKFPADASEIPYVKELAKQCKGLFVNSVFLYESLNPPSTVRKMKKSAFPEVSFRNNPSGQAEELSHFLKLFGRL